MQTSFQGSIGRHRFTFFKKIKQQSLINIWGWTLNLNWSDIKVKTKN